MRSSYRIPNAARGQYAKEYRLLVLWAALSDGDDAHTVMSDCGLTPAGSPKAVMHSIYEHRDDPDGAEGYAKDVPIGPTPSELADAELVGTFMRQLKPLLPDAYAALMARHRRMLEGQRYRLFSEWKLATALYGRRKRQSHARLVGDCDTGYAALRRWLTVHAVPEAA